MGGQDFRDFFCYVTNQLIRETEYFGVIHSINVFYSKITNNQGSYWLCGLAGCHVYILSWLESWLAASDLQGQITLYRASCDGQATWKM